MIDSLKSVLDKQIECFYAAIRKAVEKGTKPFDCIIMPEHTINAENDHFCNLMHKCIWDHLISGVFPQWLKITGKRCLIPVNNSGYIYSGEVYSPRNFSRRFPFAFILEDNGKRIAYRYFDYDDNEERVIQCIKKHRINGVRIIDWSKVDSLKKKTHTCNCSNEELKKCTEFIPLCDFLNKYFPSEACQLYINSIKGAIIEANRIIGYQTISNLSPKHLSDFREQIIKDLEEFDLNNTPYSKFSGDGNLENIKLDLLQQKDYDIISNICFNNKIVYSLTGQHDFAKCFITSEHLYHIFKTDSQCYYDYSAIVSGYLKSVELLLKEALDATFSHPNHERLWMKGKKDHLSDDDIYLSDDDPTKLWRYDPKSQSKEKNKSSKENNKRYSSIQLRLVEINKGHFSEEMGPLIWFLDEDENTYGWNISDASKRILIKCLKNYNQGCRNAYFHKKIISDFNIVEAIRTNTILCLLYLLGGYKIYDNPSADSTDNTAVDQEYNCFYKAVKIIPVERFIIKPYNRDEIKAIRLYDQNETEYDKIGNIITGIDFAIVDTFPIEVNQQFLSQIKPSQKLTISKDNIPEKMWRCSYCQGREIKRGEVKWRD